MTEDQKAVLDKMCDDAVDEALKESFTRVVVPMCFYAPVVAKRTFLQSVYAFMSNFWWNTACPKPDGRYGWLRCKLYNWTAKLHTPWYLLLHPARRSIYPTWKLFVRGALSIVLLPVGLVIWVAGGCRMRFFPKPPVVIFPKDWT